MSVISRFGYGGGRKRPAGMDYLIVTADSHCSIGGKRLKNIEELHHVIQSVRAKNLSAKRWNLEWVMENEELFNPVTSHLDNLKSTVVPVKIKAEPMAKNQTEVDECVG
ncbi:hypothetical protein PR048_009357 [Dryococelus australis]|uniref:Uncharacterized protein n=1 Tax=Dryococelus australis TaxID=614101 RepID=A0ABQ9I012_9NEOP|nr:hypothetical protein PR048_009357 [Dryococelus australis]